MNVKLRTIEVDATTAEALEKRAAERGVSVADLLASMIGDAPAASNEVAELDRRWAKVEAGETTVAHDEVVRWLETWGTPDYKPWSAR
jgi:hypothetical protein